MKSIFGKADYSMGLLLYLLGKNHPKLLIDSCETDTILKFVTHFEQKIDVSKNSFIKHDKTLDKR